MEEPKECRICFSCDHQHDIITPCLCDGSIKHVHRRCLNTYRTYISPDSCSICGYKYNIKKSWLTVKDKVYVNYFITYTLYCLLYFMYNYTIYIFIKCKFIDYIFIENIFIGNKFIESISYKDYLPIFVFIHLHTLTNFKNKTYLWKFIRYYNIDDSYQTRSCYDLIVKFIVSYCGYNLLYTFKCENILMAFTIYDIFIIFLTFINFNNKNMYSSFFENVNRQNYLITHYFLQLIYLYVDKNMSIYQNDTIINRVIIPKDIILSIPKMRSKRKERRMKYKRR